jgi:hypothetical protein
MECCYKKNQQKGIASMRRTMCYIIAAVLSITTIVVYLPFQLNSNIPSFTLMFLSASKDVAGILDPTYTKEIKTNAVDQERTGYKEKLAEFTMQRDKATENLTKSKKEMDENKAALDEEKEKKPDPKVKNWDKVHTQKIDNLTTEVQKADVRIKQNEKSIENLKPDIEKYTNLANDAQTRYDTLNVVTTSDSISNWAVFIGLELCIVGFCFFALFFLVATIYAIMKDNLWGVQFTKFAVGVPLVGWIMMDRINNSTGHLGSFLFVLVVSAVVFAPFYYLDKLTKEYVKKIDDEIKNDTIKAMQS